MMDMEYFCMRISNSFFRRGRKVFRSVQQSLKLGDTLRLNFANPAGNLNQNKEAFAVVGISFNCTTSPLSFISKTSVLSIS